jgi:hypothetical protein
VVLSGGTMAVLFWMSAAYSICMVWSRSIGDCPAPHTKQREKKGTAYADQIQTRPMVDRMAGETLRRRDDLMARSSENQEHKQTDASGTHLRRFSKS